MLALRKILKIKKEKRGVRREEKETKQAMGGGEKGKERLPCVSQF